MESVRIRSDIAQMEGYTFISGTYDEMSAKLDRPREDIIKLDTNENLYGPSLKAVEALQHITADMHIYPSVKSDELRAQLADYVSLPLEHIMVGCGADEIIDLVLRLFLEPGDTILNCPPTFTMYQLVASWIGNCQTVQVPRQADFSLDIPAIEQAAAETNAKMLFLCNPNNPDGSVFTANELKQLLALPLVVVVDEAYIEFSDEDGYADWIPQYPNLIILRTLSKWAGMAGMRVGYGLFPLGIIEHLWKIKHPFNVAVASERAARATLDDLEYMQANIQKIIDERQRLFEKLQAVDYLEPLPSQGNYIMCEVKNRSTTDLKRDLDAMGILIRNYGNKPGLAPYIRISIGKPEHTDALIAALEELA